MLFETERLALRPLRGSDRADLCAILQDAETMYAYEHAFSDVEVDAWLARQLDRYDRDGFGLWAVLRKGDGVFVGQVGITMQAWGDAQVPEIGYLLKRAHWGRGYAAEAALGCQRYAFEALGMEAVYSIIRENNLPSRRVAERCGMSARGRLVKHYYGMDMPHIVYGAERSGSEGRGVG